MGVNTRKTLEGSDDILNTIIKQATKEDWAFLEKVYFNGFQLDAMGYRPIALAEECDYVSNDKDSKQKVESIFHSETVSIIEANFLETLVGKVIYDYKGKIAKLLLLDTVNFRSASKEEDATHNLIPGVGHELFKRMVKDLHEKDVEKLYFLTPADVVDFYKKSLNKLILAGDVNEYEISAEFAGHPVELGSIHPFVVSIATKEDKAAIAALMETFNKTGNK